MKLSYNKKSKDPIYYVSQTIRNGKKTTTRTICRIGKHSELAMKYDDPLEYAKKIVAEHNEEAMKEKEDVILHVDFNRTVETSDSTYSKVNHFNVGYFVLQQIYQEMGIKPFMDKVTKENDIEFDCNDMNRYLTYLWVLDPEVKHGKYDYLEHMFDCPKMKIQDHLESFMELLVHNKEEYIALLNKNCKKLVGLDASNCCYEYMKDDPRDIISISSRSDMGEKGLGGLKLNFNDEVSKDVKDQIIDGYNLVGHTSLLICSLLKMKLNKKGFDVTIDDIRITLQNLLVTNISDVYYHSAYTLSTTLDGLSHLYPDLMLIRENHRPKDLHRILREISRKYLYATFILEFKTTENCMNML